MEIRSAERSDYPAIGDLLVASYEAIDGFIVDEELDAELRAVADRAEDSQVLVAVEGERILGTVTFVPNASSSMAEFTDPSGAGIRMLAVAAEARRRGVAEALSRACLNAASLTARSALYLHTTRAMTGAAALYLRLGFHRDPKLDWEPEPGLVLLGYRRNLS